jgi:hypothetical protein
LELYGKLRGVAGRPVIAALFLITCFLSAGLTVARECVSDIEAYRKEAIATAEFVKAETPEHAVFVTGDQHLNPVSSLAGRTILCSADLYLYYHGFDTRERRAEIAAFYQNPGDNLAFLSKYGVQYIYVSPYERSDLDLWESEAELEALFPLVYESDDGSERIFSVPNPLPVP